MRFAMFLLLAAGIGCSSQPPAATPTTPESAPVGPPAAKQVVPPPAGLPGSFRVRFRTDAGDAVDVVAAYVGRVGPHRVHVWRSPLVRYTVDHGAITPTRQTLDMPVEIQMYDTDLPPKVSMWALMLGRWEFQVVGTIGPPPDFGVAPFRFGSVLYTDFTLTPMP